MQEALIAAVFLVVSALIGSLIQPGEDQLRPLTPQVSSGEAAHDHHDSHHH
jgi:hypothetical protein